MKNQPVLINAARGPVVCQDALVEALDNNVIHSAGIDVFDDEPPTKKQEPLFNHPRAIVRDIMPGTQTLQCRSFSVGLPII